RHRGAVFVLDAALELVGPGLTVAGLTGGLRDVRYDVQTAGARLRLVGHQATREQPLHVPAVAVIGTRGVVVVTVRVRNEVDRAALGGRHIADAGRAGVEDV